MKFGVLIPAYQPDEKLTALVEELRKVELETVVVNDGSTQGLEVFDALRGMSGVTVLGYEVNQGKGHALKLGLRRMMEAGFDGAITADADGQHTPVDILRLKESMEQNPGKLVLGMRDVAQMPPRSKTGNSLTRFLFKLLYGIRLQDTQTGLRGIPLYGEAVPGVLELAGERYEYEMEMLIELPKLFPSGVVELPIETVYIDNNASTHFHAIRDGGKIYAVLFKNLPGFMATSLLSFGIDYILFNLFYYKIFRVTPPATVCARVISGSANYAMNRNLVFKGDKGNYTFLNYWKLALCILVGNSAIMWLLVDKLGLPAFLMKVLVECLVYVVSFVVQNKMAHEKGV